MIYQLWQVVYIDECSPVIFLFQFLRVLVIGLNIQLDFICVVSIASVRIHLSLLFEPFFRHLALKYIDIDKRGQLR
jgi:hypothetical protein